MKTLKKIIIIIFAIIALVLIVAAFVKKDFAVMREIDINKPKTEVFSYIRLLKNQENYSVWQTMDPNMKKDFRGTDGTVGFVSAWDSENKDIGKGEQEILKIKDGERIDFELRFFEPWESTDYAYMTTESIDEGSTLVKWGFNGKMNYPMNLMLLFINMEDELGKQLQEGLEKLKDLVEE